MAEFTGHHEEPFVSVMAVRAVWGNFGLEMQSSNIHILVAGASGQLGKRLVEEAHRRGLRVTDWIEKDWT